MSPMGAGLRRSAAGLLAAASALGVAVAEGQAPTAPPITLEWTAPEACPDAGAVLSEIRGILKSSSSAQTQVAARAVVTRSSAGWTVMLVTATESAKSKRQFSADSCDAIGRTTALILALMVDPTAKPTPEPIPAVASQPPPAAVDGGSSTASPPAASAASSREQPAAGPAVPPARRAPAPAAPEAAPRRPGIVAVGVALAADLGSLPAPGVGVALSIAFAPDPLRFEVVGAYWGAQTSSLATRPIGGNFQLLTLSARGCYAVLPGAVTLGPCVGGGLDAMSASGFGGTAPLSGAGAWGVLTGGGFLSWRAFPAFAVRLGLEAVVPLTRPEFVVEVAQPSGALPVHRASAIFARGLVGGELRFF